jgi:hypothetical protein
VDNNDKDITGCVKMLHLVNGSLSIREGDVRYRVHLIERSGSVVTASILSEWMFSKRVPAHTDAELGASNGDGLISTGRWR